MINLLTYLFQNRIKARFFSKKWLKNWAKRVFHFIRLYKIVWCTFSLTSIGVSLGHLSVVLTRDFQGKPDNLRIGNECFIGKNVKLALHDQINIGNNVIINDDCKLLTASHDIDCPAWSQISSPITIKDYAWIASSAIILPGVIIGRGAVVGAGSVVTKNVPDFHVIAGNPAKFIKERKLKNLTHSPVRWLAPFEAWLGLPKI